MIFTTGIPRSMVAIVGKFEHNPRIVRVASLTHRTGKHTGWVRDVLLTQLFDRRDGQDIAKQLETATVLDQEGAFEHYDTTLHFGNYDFVPSQFPNVYLMSYWHHYRTGHTTCARWETLESLDLVMDEVRPVETIYLRAKDRKRRGK